MQTSDGDEVWIKVVAPCWELSNGMWHTTCMQGNQGDSQLLVVESQIVNLAPDLSFGHNLCFKCPNGWCEPILDIYFSKSFQWYKEHFNPMSFDLCNCLIKFQESIRTLTGSSFGSVGVHSLPLSCIPKRWNVTPKLTLGPHLCKPLLWSWTQG